MKIKKEWVQCTDTDKILIQVTDPEVPFGFYLTDGDQSWVGADGSGVKNWIVIEECQVPIDIQEDMGWVFDE